MRNISLNMHTGNVGATDYTSRQDETEHSKFQNQGK